MASSTHQVGLVGQLEGVQECADHGPELVQNQALQVLRDVGRQCHWSAVLLAAGMGSIWDGNQAGCFPHHRDPLKAETRFIHSVLWLREISLTYITI